jgi:hypothetical protein
LRLLRQTRQTWPLGPLRKDDWVHLSIISYSVSGGRLPEDRRISSSASSNIDRGARWNYLCLDRLTHSNHPYPSSRQQPTHYHPSLLPESMLPRYPPWPHPHVQARDERPHDQLVRVEYGQKGAGRVLRRNSRIDVGVENPADQVITRVRFD